MYNFTHPICDSHIYKHKDSTSDFFNKNGYLILDLDIKEEIIKINEDVNKLINSDVAKNQDGYNYSNSIRLFEGWKYSKNIRDLSLNKLVLNTLEQLYEREPFPFQTINFVKASNQPLHSDHIHFSTYPYGWLAAAWVALTDCNTDNGTLQIVPGSHKLPYYSFKDLGLSIPKYNEQFTFYKIYEEFISDLVKASSLEIKPITLKAGQCLIWAANLIHGGFPIKDKNNPPYRESQATHYYFKGCQKYYSPMFSDESCGVFADKDLSTKDFYNI